MGSTNFPSLVSSHYQLGLASHIVLQHFYLSNTTLFPFSRCGIKLEHLGSSFVDDLMILLASDDGDLLGKMYNRFKMVFSLGFDVDLELIISNEVTARQNLR